MHEPKWCKENARWARPQNRDLSILAKLLVVNQLHLHSLGRGKIIVCSGGYLITPFSRACGQRRKDIAQRRLRALMSCTVDSETESQLDDEEGEQNFLGAANVSVLCTFWTLLRCLLQDNNRRFRKEVLNFFFQFQTTNWNRTCVNNPSPYIQ